MDPAGMIITALTAGATAALKETAGTAIKDAYQGLVALMQKKFKKNTKAEAALDGHAEDPNTWHKPLEKSIQESGAAEDKAILSAAQKVLDLVQTAEHSPKYDVRIKGDVQGFVQGDNSKVTMKFNEPEPKNRRKK